MGFIVTALEGIRTQHLRFTSSIERAGRKK
jgi:hypothetical protein